MNKNISISIDTVKRHAKRLHKILTEDNLVPPTFKLSQTQEIFSKALGCNNWFELNECLKAQEKTPARFEHPLFKDPFLGKLMQAQTFDELNKVLHEENNSKPNPVVLKSETQALPIYNPDLWLSQSALLYEEYKYQAFFLNDLDEDELTILLWRLLPKETSIVFRHFIKALSWVMVYFRKKHGIATTVEHINQFKDLKLFYMLYGKFDYTDYPHQIEPEALNDFKELVDNYSMLLCGKTIALDGLNDDFIQQHLSLWANLIEPLQTLKKLEQQDVIVLDKHWTQLLYSVHNQFYQQNAYPFFQQSTHLPILPLSVITEFTNQTWYHELWFDQMDLDFVPNNDMRVKNSHNTVLSIFKYNQSQRILGLRELVLMLSSLIPNNREIELINYFITHFSKISKISLALQDFYQTLDDSDKPLIMVIDDSNTIRQTLNAFLTQHYRIILAENAEHALSLLKYKLQDNILPHVILCDMNMPVFHEGIEDKNTSLANGYIFVKEYLTTHPDFSKIPVIFMDHEQSTAQMIEQDNNNHHYSFIEKPIRKETVYEAIAKVLNQP